MDVRFGFGTMAGSPPTGNTTSYPWRVSIWKSDELVCTGTIIFEDVVLTSCLNPHNPRDLVVRVSDGSSVHQVIYVKRKDLIFDLTLLRVTPPFPCNNSQVRAIDLAKEEEVVAPKTKANIVDWKQGNKSGAEIFATVVQCPNNFSTGLICISLLNGQVGPSTYGGPLLKNGVQIGIIPALLPQTPPLSQTVAISISYYYAWIKKSVISFDREELKIGGGIKTPEHPWLVTIRSNSTHLCDGSIISDNVVLTAASCFESHLPRNLIVQIDTTGQGSKHNVTDLEIHEKFDSLSNLNDIALLKVSPPFKFNSHVSPIYLIDDDGPYIRVEPCANMNKFTADASSNTLTKCPRNISPGHVCLESLNNTVCQWTGGPLVNDAYLIGFKPKSHFCLTSKEQKVYNYAPYYNEWIRDNFKALNPNYEGSSMWSSLRSYISS